MKIKKGYTLFDARPYVEGEIVSAVDEPYYRCNLNTFGKDPDKAPSNKTDNEQLKLD